MPQTNDLNQITPEEESLFVSLRAADWSEFYGQAQVKDALRIAIAAAQERQDVIDHVLLYGPPGVGKTTLSHLIAKSMDATLRVTSGTALSKTGDLAAILTNLEKGDVLFIDEIHRLPKAIEETLYSVMEDFALDIVIGKGPSARTVRIDLPQFTLVGATTRFGALSGPFRDRFGIVHRLTHYEPPEMVIILKQAAGKLSVTLDDESAHAIAKRSRGTPRIGLKLLKRVRDVAQITTKGKVDQELVAKALSLFMVDSLGLDDNDRRFLETIIRQHAGGPVGISTLAASLNEDSGTIEEVIEPYLLQIGFLQRTAKGRVVLAAAYTHLGVKAPGK